MNRKRIAVAVLCQCKLSFESNPINHYDYSNFCTYLLFVFVDVDECQFPGICSTSERCENTRGSYTCVAQPGLTNGQGMSLTSPAGLVG